MKKSWGHPLRCTLYICMLANFTVIGQAQTDSVNFTSLTSRDGLSSNMVTHILKDSYGWMWFGTEDGLDRFDGNQFEVYRHSDNDSSTLTNDDITRIFEDSSGNLWVATNGGGVNIYDRKSGLFGHLQDFAGINDLRNGTVLSMEEYEGKIWLGCYGGLRILDPAYKKDAPCRRRCQRIPSYQVYPSARC